MSTTTATTLEPVRAQVTVAIEPDEAFAVFAGRLADWWPAAYSIAEGESTPFLEPDGSWGETTQDGTRCEWGRVLAYEPPRRLLLGWQLDAAFGFVPDASLATEVEVRFTAQEGGGTLVELEHRGFERTADGAAIRTVVGGEGGWGWLLAQFGAAA